ncbi:hypothetical protein RsoM2USA_334 [Ralstonia phage RsoM2USA]|nr:hypothetical protein RsoM2USA_334 [Ralstonia phage RsoM2USA]
MTSIGNIHMKLREITERSMPNEWRDWLLQTNQKWMMGYEGSQQEWIRDYMTGDTFNLESFGGLTIYGPAKSDENWNDMTRLEFVPPPFKLGNLSSLTVFNRDFSNTGMSWLPGKCEKLEFDRCKFPKGFLSTDLNKVGDLERLVISDCIFQDGAADIFDQNYSVQLHNYRGSSSNHLIINGQNGVGRVLIKLESQPFNFKDIFELQEYLMDHRFPDLA